MSSSSSSDVSDVEDAAQPAAQAGHDSDSAPSHRSNSPAAASDSPPSERRNFEDSDNDASGSVSHAKKRVVASSDDDDAEGDDVKNNVSGKNLFGDGLSSSEDERKQRRIETADSSGDENRMVDREDEPIEEDEESVPNILQADAYGIDLDIASHKPIFVRFPNFISVEKKPFDPDYYEEDDDEEAMDAEGRSRLKLKVENTMRWRATLDEDGQELKESNAKMVKWSDGTMSMMLGKEVFDVQVAPLQDFNHLFIRQGFGLASQAVFTEKMSLRPHSTDSHTHRKVTLSMADRGKKSGQVKMIGQVGKNPDAEKEEAVRKEEEALRAAIRRDNNQRRTRDRHRYPAMSSSFLEGRDESDDESPNAIKGAYQRGGSRYDDRPLIGASDSDSDGEKRLKDAKIDSDDDSDDQIGRKKPQLAKKIVTSDEESD